MDSFILNYDSILNFGFSGSYVITSKGGVRKMINFSSYLVFRRTSLRRFKCESLRGLLPPMALDLFIKAPGKSCYDTFLEQVRLVEKEVEAGRNGENVFTQLRRTPK